MNWLSHRAAIGWIALSSLLFTAALVLFCYALGLDFSNEGWETGDAAGLAATWQAGLWTSVVGFGVSIVMFFIGLHRVAKPS